MILPAHKIPPHVVALMEADRARAARAQYLARLRPARLAHEARVTVAAIRRGRSLPLVALANREVEQRHELLTVVPSVPADELLPPPDHLSLVVHRPHGPPVVLRAHGALSRPNASGRASYRR